MLYIYTIWSFLSSVFFYILYNLKGMVKKEKYLTISVMVGLFFNVYMVTNISATLGLIYLSPHVPFSPSPLSSYTSELLKCTMNKVPALANHFAKIEECLLSVDIYRVRNGRLPYSGVVPEAFVTAFDKKSVFVSSHFDTRSTQDKGMIMIHECAHLALGAVDYAYTWQKHYKNLTREQHYNNADSFMETVLILCSNSVIAPAL